MEFCLVTGGGGFIGSHLVETLLARGPAVRCLVRSPERAQKLRELGAEVVVGDLDDPERLAEATRGASVVYHLAGCTKSLHEAEMFRINEGGCGAVARACATNPISVVVPCHRVVQKGGRLAGYRWGIERKRALLEREGRAAS